MAGLDTLDLSPLRPDVRAVVEQLLAGAGAPQMQIAQPIQDWQLVTIMATHLVASARGGGLPSMGVEVFAQAAQDACQIFGEAVALYKTGAAKEAIEQAVKRLEATKPTNGQG